MVSRLHGELRKCAAVRSNLNVAPPSWRLNAGWKPALHLKLGQHVRCTFLIHNLFATGSHMRHRIGVEPMQGTNGLNAFTVGPGGL